MSPSWEGRERGRYGFDRVIRRTTTGDPVVGDGSRVNSVRRSIEVRSEGGVPQWSEEGSKRDRTVCRSGYE